MAHREIDRVEIDNLEGRVAAVLLTPYPPGIPLLIPGERFNRTIVEYLKFARKFNVQFPGFDTDIHGLVEEGDSRRDPLLHGLRAPAIAQASPRLMLKRVAAIFVLLSAAAVVHAADPAKVLRVATFDIDTLDPQQFSDDPSFQVIQALFEPAYEWDYLSKTPKLTPLTAAADPEISEGGKVWTIRLKPGILFVDDAAFKGRARELTAADYVYSYKRWLDPNGRRAGQPVLTDLILGARPVVEAAKKTGKFDFDAPIEGLRALDRYTLRIRLSEANYPNMRDMLGFCGAAAREVVEAAGGDIRTRAVGTGPYRLREWKRGSRLVLEANPKYRDAHFPQSNDPRTLHSLQA
jgi:ABC-type transport system substrate-binding protein